MITQRIFISNNNNLQSPDFKITKDFNVKNLIISDKYKNGAFVFIIDVHCIFDGVKKLQEQGGVIIYRHLLKQFKECQDKLKVIFYSPIAAKYLVRLKPENYVLNLLPLIELFPIDKEGKNWSFEDDLKPFIDENYNFPQFNNASENLLSGWAAVNREKIKNGNDDEAKIKLKNSNVLIIDDEFSQWAVTYLTIFDLQTGNINFPPYNSQIEFRREWKEGRAIDFICDGAKGSDVVLSDLYIEENHEDTKPYKLREDIEKISGFELLEKIKEKYPYLPYMMFTTSNKIWNAEAFQSEGIWAWAVKENSVNVSEEDKKAQFEHFADCIKKIVNPEWKFVSRIWKALIDLKSQNLSSYWWYKNRQEAGEVLKILNNCLRILDLIYSQRAMFETKYVTDFDARQSFQIFNNLGGLCEILEINYKGYKQKTVGCYIYHLRSFYSHKLFYKTANPLEAIFCIDMLLNLLMLNEEEFQKQSREAFVPEWKPVKNTNLNYFLQFEDFVSRGLNISNDKQLLDELKQRFKNTKTEIISKTYKETIAKNERVIQLFEAHIKTVP